MVLMDNAEDKIGWFWVCGRCGLDTRYQKVGYVNRKGYDAFWGKADEEQAYSELDAFFYEQYPEYRS